MNKRWFLSLALSVSVLAACTSLAVAPKATYHYTAPVPTLRLALLPYSQLSAGKPVEVDAKLNNIATLDLIKDANLDTVHQHKIHLLIIDPTLTDYQHVHPVPTSIPGVYHFRFTPELPGGYRIWADVTPSATHQQEYVLADLGHPRRGNIDKIVSNEANVGGYHFRLTFNKPPVAGDESTGVVHITDADGNKVESLQPLMGTFGHIVGFYDDFHTVVHTHTLGGEPKSDNERSGPDLRFHLMPVKAGFLKLFVQVEIHNKELYVPFGVNVKPAGSTP